MAMMMPWQPCTGKGQKTTQNPQCGSGKPPTAIYEDQGVAQPQQPACTQCAHCSPMQCYWAGSRQCDTTDLA
eukprot:10280245-Karenia_brevis.AAC.1